MQQYGAMVMGLGLIFFGMAIMSDATKPLRSFEPFIQLMQNMSNPLLGILVAAAFTALVQSSSATTGIERNEALGRQYDDDASGGRCGNVLHRRYQPVE